MKSPKDSVVVSKRPRRSEAQLDGLLPARGRYPGFFSPDNYDILMQKDMVFGITRNVESVR